LLFISSCNPSNSGLSGPVSKYTFLSPYPDKIENKPKAYNSIDTGQLENQQAKLQSKALFSRRVIAMALLRKRKKSLVLYALR
jgi:hypothetical protein